MLDEDRGQKLGLIWAMSEIPAKDLLHAFYRVLDALPARHTGPI